MARKHRTGQRKGEAWLPNMMGWIRLRSLARGGSELFVGLHPREVAVDLWSQHAHRACSTRVNHGD